MERATIRTSSEELEKLWQSLPADSEVTVVMEPTRIAWVPLASWFRRQGATVVMVPSEQSADLRDYYAKHTKSDRLDSKILARIPLLHPEGLYAHEHLGPAVPIRRATRLRSSLVKRRSEVICRIDVLLEILSPEWHQAVSGGLTKRSFLRFCAAGYTDPHLCRRIGRARLVGSSTTIPTVILVTKKPSACLARQTRLWPSGLTSSISENWPTTLPSRPGWLCPSPPRSSNSRIASR